MVFLAYKYIINIIYIYISMFINTEWHATRDRKIRNKYFAGTGKIQSCLRRWTLRYCIK